MNAQTFQEWAGSLSNSQRQSQPQESGSNQAFGSSEELESDIERQKQKIIKTVALSQTPSEELESLRASEKWGIKYEEKNLNATTANATKFVRRVRSISGTIDELEQSFRRHREEEEENIRRGSVSVLDNEPLFKNGVEPTLSNSINSIISDAVNDLSVSRTSKEVSALSSSLNFSSKWQGESSETSPSTRHAPTPKQSDTQTLSSQDDPSSNAVLSTNKTGKLRSIFNAVSPTARVIENSDDNYGDGSENSASNVGPGAVEGSDPVHQLGFPLFSKSERNHNNKLQLLEQHAHLGEQQLDMKPIRREPLASSHPVRPLHFRHPWSRELVRSVAPKPLFDISDIENSKRDDSASIESAESSESKIQHLARSWSKWRRFVWANRTTARLTDPDFGNFDEGRGGENESGISNERWSQQILPGSLFSSEYMSTLKTQAAAEVQQLKMELDSEVPEQHFQSANKFELGNSRMVSKRASGVDSDSGGGEIAPPKKGQIDSQLTDSKRTFRTAGTIILQKKLKELAMQLKRGAFTIWKNKKYEGERVRRVILSLVVIRGRTDLAKVRFAFTRWNEVIMDTTNNSRKLANERGGEAQGTDLHVILRDFQRWRREALLSNHPAQRLGVETQASMFASFINKTNQTMMDGYLGGSLNRSKGPNDVFVPGDLVQNSSKSPGRRKLRQPRVRVGEKELSKWNSPTSSPQVLRGSSPRGGATTGNIRETDASSFEIYGLKVRILVETISKALQSSRETNLKRAWSKWVKVSRMQHSLSASRRGSGAHSLGIVFTRWRMRQTWQAFSKWKRVVTIEDERSNCMINILLKLQKGDLNRAFRKWYHNTLSSKHESQLEQTALRNASHQGRARMKGVFRRLTYRLESRAWQTWLKFVQHQKLQQEMSVRLNQSRVLHRLESRLRSCFHGTLSSSFSHWKAAVQDRGQLRVIAVWFSRMSRDRQSRAFQRWKQFVQLDSVAQARAEFRRSSVSQGSSRVHSILRSWKHHQLRSAFGHWRTVITVRMSRMNLVLERIVQKFEKQESWQKARVWRRWCLMVQEKHKEEEMHLHAASVVTKWFAISKERSLSQAFSKWNKFSKSIAVNALRKRSVVLLIMSHVRRMQHVAMTRALYHWRLVAEEQDHKLELLIAGAQRLLNIISRKFKHRKRMYFELWSVRTAKTRVRSEMQHKLMKRIANRRLGAAWNKWKHETDYSSRLETVSSAAKRSAALAKLQVQFSLRLRMTTANALSKWRKATSTCADQAKRQERGVAVLRRWQARASQNLVHLCLDSWKQYVQKEKIRKLRIRRCVIAMRRASRETDHLNLENAIQRWKMATLQSTLTAHVRSFMLRRLLVQMQKRKLCTAFKCWRSSTDIERKRSREVHRVLQLLRHRSQATAFRKWAFVVGDLNTASKCHKAAGLQRRRLSGAHRVLSALHSQQYTSERVAFDRWKGSTLDYQNQRRACRTLVCSQRRLERAVQQKAFARWKCKSTLITQQEREAVFRRRIAVVVAERTLKSHNLQRLRNSHLHWKSVVRSSVQRKRSIALVVQKLHRRLMGKAFGQWKDQMVLMHIEDIRDTSRAEHQVRVLRKLYLAKLRSSWGRWVFQVLHQRRQELRSNTLRQAKGVVQLSGLVQRRALISRAIAFRHWLAVTSAEKHLWSQNRTRLALLGSMASKHWNYRMKDSFHVWKGEIARDRMRRNSVNALARISRRHSDYQMRERLLRWKSQVRRASDAEEQGLDSMRRILAKMHNMHLSKAFEHWKVSVHRAQSRQVVMRRIVARLHQREVFAAFKKWSTSCVHDRFRTDSQATALRSLRRWMRHRETTSVHRALAQWKEKVGEARGVEVEMAKLQRYQAVSRVVLQMKVRVYSQKVSAFHVWSKRTVRQRQKVFACRSLLRFICNSWKTKTRSALRRWATITGSLIEQDHKIMECTSRASNIVEHVVSLWSKKSMQRAFKKLVRHSDVSYRKELHLGRLTKHLMFSLEASAFRKWHLVVKQIKETESTTKHRQKVQRRVLRRLVHRKTSSAMDTWKQFVIQSRASKLAFENKVKLTIRARASLRIIGVIQSQEYRQKSRALRKWMVHTVAIQQHSRDNSAHMKRLVQLLSHKQLYHPFNLWKMSLFASKLQDKRKLRVMQHFFKRWAIVTNSSKSTHKLLTIYRGVQLCGDVIHRKREQIIRNAFGKWNQDCHLQLRQRMTLGRLVARIKRQFLRQALQKLRNFVHFRKDSDVAVVRLNQVLLAKFVRPLQRKGWDKLLGFRARDARLSRALHNVLQLAKKSHHVVLLRCFHRWSQLCNESSISARSVLLGKYLERRYFLKLSVAFQSWATWSRNASNLDALRIDRDHMTLRQMMRAWRDEAWKGRHRLELSSRDVKLQEQKLLGSKSYALHRWKTGVAAKLLAKEMHKVHQESCLVKLNLFTRFGLFEAHRIQKRAFKAWCQSVLSSKQFRVARAGRLDVIRSHRLASTWRLRFTLRCWREASVLKSRNQFLATWSGKLLVVRMLSRSFRKWVAFTVADRMKDARDASHQRVAAAYMEEYNHLREKHNVFSCWKSFVLQKKEREWTSSVKLAIRETNDARERLEHAISDATIATTETNTRLLVVADRCYQKRLKKRVFSRLQMFVAISRHVSRLEHMKEVHHCQEAFGKWHHFARMEYRLQVSPYWFSWRRYHKVESAKQQVAVRRKKNVLRHVLQEWQASLRESIAARFHDARVKRAALVFWRATIRIHHRDELHVSVARARTNRSICFRVLHHWRHTIHAMRSVRLTQRSNALRLQLALLPFIGGRRMTSLQSVSRAFDRWRSLNQVKRTQIAYLSRTLQRDNTHKLRIALSGWRLFVEHRRHQREEAVRIQRTAECMAAIHRIRQSGLPMNLATYRATRIKAKHFSAWKQCLWRSNKKRLACRMLSQTISKGLRRKLYRGMSLWTSVWRNHRQSAVRKQLGLEKFRRIRELNRGKLFKVSSNRHKVSTLWYRWIRFLLHMKKKRLREQFEVAKAKHLENTVIGEQLAQHERLRYRCGLRLVSLLFQRRRVQAKAKCFRQWQEQLHKLQITELKDASQQLQLSLATKNAAVQERNDEIFRLERICDEQEAVFLHQKQLMIQEKQRELENIQNANELALQQATQKPVQKYRRALTDTAGQLEGALSLLVDIQGELERTKHEVASLKRERKASENYILTVEAELQRVTSSYTRLKRERKNVFHKLQETVEEKESCVRVVEALNHQIQLLREKAILLRERQCIGDELEISHQSLDNPELPEVY